MVTGQSPGNEYIVPNAKFTEEKKKIQKKGILIID